MPERGVGTNEITACTASSYYDTLRVDPKLFGVLLALYLVQREVMLRGLVS
jgi:hypothetical protein